MPNTWYGVMGEEKTRWRQYKKIFSNWHKTNTFLFKNSDIFCIVHLKIVKLKEKKSDINSIKETKEIQFFMMNHTLDKMGKKYFLCLYLTFFYNHVF